MRVLFFSFLALLSLLASFGLSLTRPSIQSLRRSVYHLKTRRVQFERDLASNSTFVHHHFMSLAVQEAKEAGRKGEVPIGAVVVDCDGGGSYRVLSRGHNMVEATQDATAHAEVTALRRASKSTNNWRLFNRTLYSTMEPCPICLSSAQAFRIHTIVYGAPQIRLGAIESHMRMLEDYNHPFHTIEEVVPRIMEKECAELLKDFFRKKRVEKPRIKMSEYITAKKPFLSRLRQRRKP